MLRLHSCKDMQVASLSDGKGIYAMTSSETHRNVDTAIRHFTLEYVNYLGVAKSWTRIVRRIARGDTDSTNEQTEKAGNSHKGWLDLNSDEKYCSWNAQTRRVGYHIICLQSVERLEIERSAQATAPLCSFKAQRDTIAKWCFTVIFQWAWHNAFWLPCCFLASCGKWGDGHRLSGY